MLLSVALVAFVTGCAIFDDTDEVTQDDALTTCTFLGTDVGICSSGVPTNDGTCLPPIGYETVEASCDGLDNDCNGVADRGCPCAYLGMPEGVCSQGTTATDGTCSEPAAYETTESLCDQLDNDCDGVADEGCPCEFRQLSVGVCASTIGDDGTCTAPAAFEGSEQSCDGLDNDCDGSTDEEVDGACALTVGICAQAVVACDGGDLGDCGPSEYGPLYEAEEASCDGLDNDCDGVEDEGCSCAFDGAAAGVCADGAVDGAGTCQPPGSYEADEVACDDLDNDCDGTVDEGCPCSDSDTRPCGTTIGACEEGEQVCTAGVWGPCEMATGPTAEVCDGIDNDCDGDADEALRVLCSRQDGVCNGASIPCDVQRDRRPQCTPEELVAHSTRFESGEVSCDGRDNDCDGVVDEGCPCQFGGTPVGVCGDAIVGDSGECKPPDAHQETESECDAADNDCDGIVDESCPCDYKGLTEGVCTDGRVSETTGSCTAPPGYSQTDDDCDRVDNDCDGEADEDAPSTESNCADGRDDDCDGLEDCEDDDCLGKVCDQQVAEEPMVSALEQEVAVESKTCRSDGACR